MIKNTNIDTVNATKDQRTLNALARIMGVFVSRVQGELPALGERGEATADIQGWWKDGEIAVVETLYVKYHRLSSGRLGEWTITLHDDLGVHVVEGYGQW